MFCTKAVAERADFYNSSRSAAVQSAYRRYIEILSLLYPSYFLFTYNGSGITFILVATIFCLGNKCGSFFCWRRVTGNSFICWSLARVGRVFRITFIWDYQERVRDKDLVTVEGCYSHHLPKEDDCFLGRRGEGGELDLGLLEPCTGGRNHLPGVSGHWRGSEGSGVLLGISSTTGGPSSRGMREVAAASGGSNPTSIATSGNEARRGVCTGPPPLCQISTIQR